MIMVILMVLEWSRLKFNVELIKVYLFSILQHSFNNKILLFVDIEKKEEMLQIFECNSFVIYLYFYKYTKAFFISLYYQ